MNDPLEVARTILAELTEDAAPGRNPDVICAMAQVGILAALIALTEQANKRQPSSKETDR